MRAILKYNLLDNPVPFIILEDYSVDELFNKMHEMYLLHGGPIVVETPKHILWYSDEGNPIAASRLVKGRPHDNQ